METSTSLLDRLRQCPDEESWRRLDNLYRPLILRWVQRDPALRDEADDLTQEIVSVVFRELANFKRERTGAFRKWLRTIMDNRVKGHRRKRQNRPQALGMEPDEGPLAQLADDHSDLARRWDQEHNEHVTGRLLKLVAEEFIELHVRALHRHVLDGVSAEETAAELGTSVNVVLLAKSRILACLREVGKGLLD